ncbi:MAG TPA: hypothetical protein VGE96_03325 [Steroidobacteraceae bacterium]|jgi:hypothetical protein
MNDSTVAAENYKEESTEAVDFVELGEVKDSTKGGLGFFYDGAVGNWH